MRRGPMKDGLSFRSRVVRPAVVSCTLMLVSLSLSAAITLQNPSPTEATFLLQEDSKAETSQRISIADLLIQAKHRGKGQVHISHTPLFDGMSMTPYLLMDEKGRVLDGRICAEYSGDMQQRKTYHLCSLQAEFLQPMLFNEETQTSTIVLTLFLEL